MKFFLLSVCLCCFCLINSKAQTKKDSFHLKKMPFIYFEGGAGKSHFNFAIAVSLKNSWGLNFNQRVYEYSPENYPSDYKKGFCLFGDCAPKDVENISTIQIQKMFFTKYSLIRYNVAAGFGELTHTKLSFNPAPRSSGWFNFSSNYNISIQKYYAIGFIASAAIELPVSRVFGVKGTTFAFLTNAKKYSKIGAEVSLVYGYIREKLHYRKKAKEKKLKTENN